ncbi:C26 family cysteine hydrolase domain-containing family [bacterium]|nr:C26 family cysteine hydrolase domain-containing family [bacterium]
MKLSVLLINCYKSADDQRIEPFFNWLSPYFEVNTVLVDALSSAVVKEDGVIISGSEHHSSQDLPQQLKAILLETEKPLLGVCYGHQALASAWGAKVIKKKLIEEEEVVRVVHSKGILSNLGLFFNALESHAEHVVPDKHLARHFEIMAYSDSCKVEVIRHLERPLWGVQFHPERSGQMGLRLAANFENLVKFVKENS